MGLNNRNMRRRQFTIRLLTNDELRKKHTIIVQPGVDYSIPKKMPGAERFPSKSSKALKLERYLAKKRKVADFARNQAREYFEMCVEPYASKKETLAHNAAIARGRG